MKAFMKTTMTTVRPLSPTSSIETITPDQAALYLKSFDSNRPLSARRVLQYAQDLAAGKWLLNGESISFDWNGNMIQGQHRCHAVIKSGVSMTTFVNRGLNPEVFSTLDSGKPRNARDVLAISGEKNTHVLSAAIRAAVRILYGVGERDSLTNRDALAVLEDLPTLRFWTGRFVGEAKLKRLIPSSFVGACAVAANKYGSDIVETFVNQVASGTNLSADSPAFLLRERFATRPRGAYWDQDTQLSLIIKALSAHINGKRIKMLRFNADESFPEL
jgi:hypothetical protein